MNDDLISPAELALRLGKSKDYWLRRARAKEIPHRRLGRTVSFTEQDVVDILAAARVEAGDPLRSQTGRSQRHSRKSA